MFWFLHQFCHIWGVENLGIFNFFGNTKSPSFFSPSTALHSVLLADGSKNNFTAKGDVTLRQKNMFWSLTTFGYSSYTTVRGQKNRFQQLRMYKIFKHCKHPCITCLRAYLFVIIKYFSFAFFLFIPFATQLFSTPDTSSNFRNQAPPFTGNLLFYSHLNAHIETCTWYIQGLTVFFSL